MSDNSTAWLVLAFGGDRSYGGNEGYIEDFQRSYVFDSNVQNHKQVRPGALILMRNRERLLGAARVVTISSEPGTKMLRRCPTCGTTSHTHRTTKKPAFKCKSGHEFEFPEIEGRPCINYEAIFGDSFQPAILEVSIKDLRSACPSYADQVSIQRIQLDLLGNAIYSAIPSIDALLEPTISIEALSSEGSPDSFVPNALDRRETILRQLKLRRGQGAFRSRLIERYTARCMISRCPFPFLLEAAHISPYRGENDNAPENGLLLRPDLHTMFDLDILGIEPESLVIHIHPGLAGSEYSAFAGVKLLCGSSRPSRAALLSRWEAFLRRSEDLIDLA
jgi:putative restriction endonuclease